MRRWAGCNLREKRWWQDKSERLRDSSSGVAVIMPRSLRRLSDAFHHRVAFINPARTAEIRAGAVV